MGDASLPWWEFYPGRLEWEISRLETAGVGVVVNQDRRVEEGVVELLLDVPDVYTGADSMSLTATFPDFYPFYRPDVFAPDLDLGLHQHPFGKNLCLVGRASRAWHTDDSLAWLITSQLATALRLGASGGGGDEEENQGEPFSDYYTYAPESAVLVDSSWLIPDEHRHGVATLLVDPPAPVEGTRFLAFAKALSTDRREPIVELEREVLLLGGGRRVEGRWSMLEQPVRRDSAKDIWVAAEEGDPCRPMSQSLSEGNFQYRLVAFPEEHRRDSIGIGWVLVVRQVGRRRQEKQVRGKPSALDLADKFHLIKAQRIGRIDIQQRLPTRLALLNDKKVAVFGLGALGSVVVSQLAKNGLGRLALIDRDVLEPGNASRHACGVNLAGISKSGALNALAHWSNPYIETEPMIFNVGGHLRGTDQREMMAKIIDEADLVIDATAEVGIQELTADLAHRRRKDWLMVEATNGAWGGTVVYIPGASRACFSCFQWHRIDQTIPIPPADAADMTQPIGCAEPTFTGTSFDLDEVSLQAARVAVAALRGEASVGADNVTLRTSEGSCLPQWTHHEIDPHPRCQH